jgi:transcriptional regulator with GAF, ATPase, and Fis domain
MKPDGSLKQSCPMCQRVLYDLDAANVKESSEIKTLRAENAQLRAIVSLIRRALKETKVETLEENDSMDIHKAQRLLVMEALERSGGNRSIAAGLVGVARSTFFVWMQRYGIRDKWTRKRRKVRGADPESPVCVDRHPEPV